MLVKSAVFYVLNCNTFMNRAIFSSSHFSSNVLKLYVKRYKEIVSSTSVQDDLDMLVITAVLFQMSPR